VTALEQPPYCPDLSPPHFSCFCNKKKNILKEQRFESANKVTAQATKELIEQAKMVSRNASQFYSNFSKSKIFRRTFSIKTDITAGTIILYIINHSVSYLKRDISETGPCLCLLAEPTQLYPINRGGLCRPSLEFSLRNVTFQVKG
jgi:hypothetical protein